MFFFFKQKTAYARRISDWSSDVCSSDLEQEAVDPRPDPADDDFAKLDVEQRHKAAQRGEAVMHGVNRAARGRRRDHREQRARGHAEAHFLAFHIAAYHAEVVPNRLAEPRGGKE